MANITFLSVLAQSGVDVSAFTAPTAEWVTTFDAETGHRVGFVTVTDPLILSSTALGSIKTFMLKNGYSLDKASAFISALASPMRVTRDKGSTFNFKMLGPDAPGYDSATAEQSSSQIAASLGEIGALFIQNLSADGASGVRRADQFFASRGWTAVPGTDFILATTGYQLLVNDLILQKEYFYNQAGWWGFGLATEYYYNANSSVAMGFHDGQVTDVLQQALGKALNSLLGTPYVYMAIPLGFESNNGSSSGFGWRVYKRPRTAADGEALVLVPIAVPPTIAYKTGTITITNTTSVNGVNVISRSNSASGYRRLTGYDAKIATGYTAAGASVEAYGNAGTAPMPGMNGYRYAYGLSRDFLSAEVRATPKSLVTERQVTPVGFDKPVKLISVVDAQWSLTLSKSQVVRIFSAYAAGSKGAQRTQADANIAALRDASWDKLTWWQLTNPYTTDLATCVQNSPAMRQISTDVNVWEALDYDLDPSKETKWADRVKGMSYITSTFFANEPYAVTVADMISGVSVTKDFKGVVSYEMPPGKTSTQEMCATAIGLGQSYSLPPDTTLMDIFGYPTVAAIKTGYADAILATEARPATQLTGTPSTLPSYSRSVEFDQVYYHVLGSKEGLTPFIAATLHLSYGSDFSKLFPSVVW